MLGKKKEKVPKTEPTVAAKTEKGKKKGFFRSIGRWIFRHKVLVCLLLIVAIVAGVGLNFYQKRQQMTEMMGSFSVVETATVKRQTLMDSISLSGTVASADTREVSVAVDNAEVTRVYVEVGDIVTAGQVICEFDSEGIEDDLTNAKNNKILSDYKSNKEYQKVVDAYNDALTGEEDVSDNYSEAQANAKSSWQAAIDASAAAQTAYDNAVKAEAEKKTASEAAAKAANGIDATNYATAKEALSDAKAELEGLDAETDADRIAELESTIAAAESTIALYEAKESAASSYQAAQKATESAKSTLDRAKSTESSAASSYDKIVEERGNASEKAQETLKNATANLESANMERKYSTDESAERIEAYKQQLEDCYLTAPVSGMIVSLSVAEGQIYKSGSVICEIADYQNFIVNASVDEYDISSLKKGMEAAVKIEAVSEEELPATLSFVSPTPSASTGFGSSGSSSYAIEIALNEPNEMLRIGMSAQASVVLNAAKDVLTVPYDCIETNKKGESVIYVQQNGQRKEVAVTVGMEGDYYVEVSGDGLEEGMKVYYGTAMVTDQTFRGEEDMGGMFDFGGGMPGGMPSFEGGGGMPDFGGGMPGGGGMPSGGGRPSGGMPSGGGMPGGF